jgi:hypothetical protein
MKQNDYTHCSATRAISGGAGTTQEPGLVSPLRHRATTSWRAVAFTGIDAVRNNGLPGMPWGGITQFAQTLSGRR